MASLIKSFFAKQDLVPTEYPIIFKFYNEIVSNNPNIFDDEFESKMQDEIFLQKHKLYENDFQISLNRTFKIIKQENLQMSELVVKMMKIEKKVRQKICMFATKKSLTINNIFPELMKLEERSLLINDVCQKIKQNYNTNLIQTIDLNNKIKNKIHKKQMLVLFCELLKKRMVHTFYNPNKKVEDRLYLSSLNKTLSTFHHHEYLLNPSQFNDYIQSIKEVFLLFFNNQIVNFNGKNFVNLMNFLKNSQKIYFLRHKKLIVSDLFNFCVKFLVVKNIRNSVFDSEIDTITASHLLIMNDFFKMEVLLPIMNSNSICRFLTDIFHAFRIIFQQIDNFISSLYNLLNKKFDTFFEELIYWFHHSKIEICEYISSLISKIIEFIKFQELNEITVSGFLAFLLSYENFLRALKVFVCHIPSLPNNQIFNIINEYIKHFKEKSLRVCFSEIFDENWFPVAFNSEIFVQKLQKNLANNDEKLKFSKYFTKDIDFLKKQEIEKIFKFSFKTAQNSHMTQNDSIFVNSGQNSTPMNRMNGSSQFVCRSALTLITIMVDYGKFYGIFPDYREIILEDCNFLINMWLYANMIKFTPSTWVNKIINFQKPSEKLDTTIQSVESRHDFLIFKVRFSELRHFLFDFNQQLLGSCAIFQIPVKYFLNKLMKETNPLYFNTKDLIIFLKSIDHIFKAFNFLDSDRVYFYNPELSQNLTHFLLNYYFFEKFRNKPFFDKIVQFKWNQINDIIPPNKNIYLSHYLSLFLEAQSEFLKAGEEILLEKYEIMEYMAIICDMLLYILMEFYSRTFDCSHLGRIQMKHDLTEVYKAIEGMITESNFQKLKNKYNSFLENFFIYSSRDIYKYIFEQFNEISFCLTKIFLIVNKSQDQLLNSKKEIVVSSEQEKILLSVTQNLHKRLMNESQDEDYLERNILAEAVEYKEDLSGTEDKLKIFLNILKFEKKQ